MNFLVSCISVQLEECKRIETQTDATENITFSLMPEVKNGSGTVFLIGPNFCSLEGLVNETICTENRLISVQLQEKLDFRAPYQEQFITSWQNNNANFNDFNFD